MIVLFTDFLLHGLYTGHMKAGIPAVRAGDIDWKPERLSASFHGRDLFAPGAPMLSRGEPPPGQPRNDGRIVG